MKKIVKISGLILAFLITSNGLIGQKSKVSSKLEYDKQHDGTRVLAAKLFLKTKSGIVPLTMADVMFSAENDSSTVELGTVATNDEGWGYLHIEKGFNLPQTEDGTTIYKLKYKGNDTLRRAVDDLKIRDVILSLESQKTEDENAVIIKVSSINGEPENKTKVNLYVKRLHSLLPIEDGKTDSLGLASFVVPKDIPGDYDGNIILVATIEKNRKFGALSTQMTVDWGIPNTYSVSESAKSLWSQSAPLWMQIAVFGVFAIVGVFFFVSLYHVSMIPKDR